MYYASWYEANLFLQRGCKMQNSPVETGELTIACHMKNNPDGIELLLTLAGCDLLIRQYPENIFNLSAGHRAEQSVN